MTQIETAKTATDTTCFTLAIYGCGGEHTIGTASTEVASYWEEEDEDTEFGTNTQVFERESVGGVWFEVTTTTLKIYNNFAGERAFATLDGVLEEEEDVSPLEIKYAFLIFDVEGVDTV